MMTTQRQYTNVDKDDFCIIQVGEVNDGSGTKLNSLSAAVRRQLLLKLESALADPQIKGIILMGWGGDHFSVGMDIREFKQRQESPVSTIPSSSPSTSLADICNALQNSSKPTVAALHGYCLGGGLEIALCCDFRVASSSLSTLLGLPEVNIGLIPGAGGTQRLPRLTSVAFALDVITSGRMISSTEALKEKLIDAIVPPSTHTSLSLEQVAIQWANWGCSLGPDILRNTRKLQFRSIYTNEKHQGEKYNKQCCHEYKTQKLPPISRGGEAKHMAVCAIEASFQLKTFQQGLCAEEAIFQDLLHNSKQGKALRHAFFAERTAQHNNDDLLSLKRNDQDAVPDVRHVGVIGAGTMGSGIVIALLLANLDVTLIDNNPSSLAKCLSFVQATIAKRRGNRKATTANTSKKNMEPKLTSSTDISALAPCHVIIEAVFEDLTLKQDIFQQLSKLTSHTNTLLLTNTSTLDITKIFSKVNPAQLPNCCGMHFFSPAHVMRLVEIVIDTSSSISSSSSNRTIQTVRRLCKRMNKIGVLVGNCDGFVGNRMVHPYTTESVLCLEEGSTTIAEVDNALRNHFGMALGPFAMSDLAGNDIGYLIRKSKGLVRNEKTGIVGPLRSVDMRYPEIADDLVVLLKRVGQKALKGWYDYDLKQGNGRKPLPSVEVENFLSTRRDLKPCRISPEEIIMRVLFPLVNEGFKILEEGIAQRPGDIDVIYLFGYGWPRHTGGPMFWAENEVGLPTLLAKLEEYWERYPGSAYFKPSDMLRACVDMKLSMEEYCSAVLKKGTSKASKL